MIDTLTILFFGIVMGTYLLSKCIKEMRVTIDALEEQEELTEKWLSRPIIHLPTPEQLKTDQERALAEQELNDYLKGGN